MLQKDTPGTQKHAKSHYQKQAPSPLNPSLKDTKDTSKKFIYMSKWFILLMISKPGFFFALSQIFNDFVYLKKTM